MRLPAHAHKISREFIDSPFLADVRDLISKILNTNPDNRYSIADIRAHKWYKQLNLPPAPR